MMRRFRLWLARKLIGHESFIANTTFTNGTVTATSNTDAVWGSTAAYFGPGEYTEEDDMGKKKKRSKAAGKAAAKNKAESREKKAKAHGGKGAR